MTDAIEHASPAPSGRVGLRGSRSGDSDSAVISVGAGVSPIASADEGSPLPDDRPARPPIGLSPAARRGVLALMDQAAVSGTAFLTTVVLGRVCGPEELGVFSLGFTVIIMAICVQDSLVSAPYTVFSPRLAVRSRALYAGSTLALAGLLALAIVACLGAAGALGALAATSQRFLPVAGALTAAMPFILLREFARRLAFAGLEMGTALAIDAAVAAIQLAALGLLVATGVLSAAIALGAIGAACGLVGIGWLVGSRNSFACRAGEVARDWRQNWMFGRWILAAQSSAVANSYATHWLLAALLGTAATGGLAACMSVVALANPLVLGASNLLSPSAARAWSETGAGRLRALVTRSAWLVGAAIALVCGLVVCFGEPIMAFVYGRAYAGLGHVLAVVAAGYLVSALGLAPSHGLFAMQRSDWNFYPSILGVAVTLLAGAGLAVPFGITGAAYGFLLGNITKTAGTYVAYRRILAHAPGPFFGDCNAG
jgi:O-antigen/teichoic acid export membrane protein